MNKLFVGRHGQVDAEWQLCEQGVTDAHTMAEQLREAGFSRKGIIMSSIADRALQTAKVIKDDLEIPTLVPSPLVRKVGERPQPVQNLHQFLGDVLAACNVTHDDSDVLVVTHLPLVAALADGGPTFGQIYPVPEGWQNPRYRPDFAFCLSEPDTW